MAVRTHLRIPLLLLSLMLTATVASVVTWFAAPHVNRWLMLSRLDSDDEKQREAALNYVLRRAPEDERVRRGAMRRLGEIEDPNRFLELMYFLDLANLWTVEHVPAESWLRWLSLASAAESPETRVLASQRLADVPQLADRPAMVEILDRLIGDENADVRYNALVASAELSSAAGDTKPYRQIVERATGDAQPVIARKAWLYRGLMAPDETAPSAGTTALAPEVVQAMQWATGTLLPDEPASVLAEVRPSQVNAENQVRVWRAILTAPRDVVRDWLHEAAALPTDQATSDVLLPVVLAACYRAAQPVTFADPEASREDAEADGPTRIEQINALAQLAALEGMSAGALDQPVDRSMPDMAVLAAFAATNQPHEDDLLVPLASELSAVRDLACVLAAQRLDPDQRLRLAGSLLRDLDNHARMAGAILVGLTGVRPTATLRSPRAGDDQPGQQVDLLGYVAEYPHPVPHQMTRLAEWMLLPQLDEGSHYTGIAMLSRPDLPTSSILLAMLHRGQPEAVDYLLVPRGEPDLPFLQHLLIELRWWRVLRQYLRDDAPELWLWGDAAVQSFQLELLREWWLLNRQRPGAIRAGVARDNERARHER